MIAIWLALVALQTYSWRVALIGLAILGALLFLALIYILIGFCVVAFRSDDDRHDDDAEEDFYTRLEKLSQRERDDLASASRTPPPSSRPTARPNPFTRPAVKGFRK